VNTKAHSPPPSPIRACLSKAHEGERKEFKVVEKLDQVQKIEKLFLRRRAIGNSLQRKVKHREMLIGRDEKYWLKS
jgi:hypothetical protein